MKRGLNVRLSIVVPVFFQQALQRNANKRMESLSDFAGKILIENFEDYAELDKNEKIAIGLKKNDYRADMFKYIRSKSAERLNFLKNVRKQIINFSQNPQLVDKKEILHNLALSREIAKINEWHKERKVIGKIIKYIRTHKIMRFEEIYNEIKQIEVKIP